MELVLRPHAPSLCYNLDMVAGAFIKGDPTLVRFRTALAEMYGARIERIVLYGARAAMRGRIPITTFAVLLRMWTAAAGNFIGSPISAGVSVINAMAYDVGAYRDQSPHAPNPPRRHRFLTPDTRQ